jgi:hypothetical protein
MKHQQLLKRLVAALTLSFLFTLTGIITPAQTTTTLLIADVPFQFNVGKKIIPAGKYQIRKMNIGVSHVLRLSDEQGNTVALMQIRERIASYSSQSDNHWTFNRYGDQYFLSQVWMVGENGYGLPESRVERQVAESLTSARPTEVSIHLTQQ